MTHFDLGDARLAYTTRGQGDPVILVHGSASDHRTWTHQMDALAAGFRVTAYSRRYHWPNERIPEGVDYAMMQHVHDLEAVIQAVGGAPVHLVGHSYGAFLCLVLAIQAPAAVRSLVLAEPPVLPLVASDPPKASELLALLATRPRTAFALLKFGATGIGPARAAIKRGDREAALRSSGRAILGRDVFDGLPADRLAQARDNLIDAEFIGSGFAPLAPGQVRGVRAPTLLITGERSAGLFRRLADRLEELLPQVERVEIAGATHLMHEQDPPAFNAAVLAFLAREPDAEAAS